MEQICGNCEYFVKHFVNIGGRFVHSELGHCTYPMVKNRQVQSKACKYFEERYTDDSINIIEITIKHKTL